jgi:hypothetical protein
MISCKTSSSIEAPQKIAYFISNQFLTDGDFRALDTNDRKFQYQATDLNGDGIVEYLVSFSSPYFCGSGGCNLLILDKNFNLITNFTITRTPVLVDSKTTNGWNDIILWSNGDYHRMKFNSKKSSYPTNPSVEEVIELESKDLGRMTSLFENTTALKTYAF